MIVHVLVLFGMAAQLPTAEAAAAHAVRVAHSPSIGHPASAQDPYFDLTPSELGRIGGPTLVEVLEAPPSIPAPKPIMEFDEAWALGESSVHDENLVSVRFGRAPPVR